MTIDQLRKNITVKTWMIDTDGIDISYRIIGEDSKPTEQSIFLSIERSCQLLIQVGEIDIIPGNPFKIVWNDKEYLWEEFALWYKLCQWEALRIAIAYEYEKIIEVEMLEMDTTFKALQL